MCVREKESNRTTWPGGAPTTWLRAQDLGAELSIWAQGSGVGLRAQDLGSGLRIWAQGSGCGLRAQDLGSGLRIWGLGFGAWLRAQDLGVEVWSVGIRV